MFDFIKRIGRRQKLKKAGLKIVEVKQGQFHPSTISICEICKILGVPEYALRIRNLILAETKRKPEYLRHIIIPINHTNDLHLTHEGIESFFDLFAGHFDARVIDCLCKTMKNKDERQRLHLELVRMVRAATEAELESVLDLKELENDEKTAGIIRLELEKRRRGPIRRCFSLIKQCAARRKEQAD